MVDIKARGDFEKVGEGPAFGNWDIGNDAAGFADEVPVFGEVRAVAGGLAFDIHLFGETALHEGFEAVVDGCQRNRGDSFLGLYENLGGRGMVTVFEEHIVNLAPLRGEAMAVVADRFFVGGLGRFVHRKQEYIAAPKG